MRLSRGAAEERGLRQRIVWIGVAAALGIFILVGRMWLLQIHRGEEFSAKSSGNFIKEIRVPADRGLILDRHGEVLVDNRPSYDVYLTPAFCAGCDEVLGRLSTLLNLEEEERTRTWMQIEAARGLERFRPLLVRLDLDRDAVDLIEANRDRLPGVDLVASPHRNYRNAEVAAHLLGYLGEITQEELERSRNEDKGYRLGDYIGRRGVEREYEDYLRGKDGIERVVTDAKGRRIPELERLIPKEERYAPSTPGRNVVLSLDARLQRRAEELFDHPVGALVVLDVNTGYVLAMVSKPAYDPNRLTGRISRSELREIAEDPFKPMLFRPIQNHYHPGSIFKVVTQLAAFEHGFDGHVFCGGSYTLGRRRWRCHRDAGHGWVGPEEAMKVSCDTWFYAAADRIGIDPIAEMSKRMGLGTVTGFEGENEVPGIVPSVAYHNRRTPGGYQRGFALNASIGQGDSNVTPLQMAVVFSAIANGGTVYKPKAVRRIETPEGRVVEEFLPEVRTRLNLPREHLATIRRGLEKVVHEPGGTAYWHRIPGLRVAGKTGTAQVVRIGAVRQRTEEMDFFRRHHAWFAAYAPAEEPEIAVVVLAEHGGGGGAVAAPIAMRVIAEYFQMVEEEREPEKEEAEDEVWTPPLRDRLPTGGPYHPIRETQAEAAG